ncbi:hypothetical protein FRC07_009991 [Ceratobasidium sp. 392]|nr:hypothetical protein FRC07_009991 [Ceratobasidium sp. 392]
MPGESPGTILSLNFFVHGDTKRDVDVVRISPNATISDLVHAIQEVYLKGRKGDHIQVDVVFKIDVILDEVVSVQLPEVDSCLPRIDLVSDHWSGDPKRVRGKVEILVKVASRKKAAMSIPGSLDLKSSADIDSSSNLLVDIVNKKLVELSSKQNKYRDEIHRGPTPSAVSKASVFHDQQHWDSTPIYNGRPREKQGLPLEIYHPVFHAFAAYTRNATIPSSSDLYSMELLLSCAQNTYKDKDKRISAIKNHLESLLDHVLTIEDANWCKADGVIKTKSLAAMEGRKAYALIMEVKNKIGTSDADPSIPGAESYAHYWSNITLDGIREQSCSVYVEQVVVHPLTDFLWLGHQAHESDRLGQVTRIFRALREGIKSLDRYYESLPKQQQPMMARFFPYINWFHRPDGQEVVFDYFEVLATCPVRPVFRARIRSKPEELVVVKFVRDYNSTAHRMLAEKRLAPRLLYDSVDPLDCGLRMIVMESMEAPDLYMYLKDRSTNNRTLEIQAVRTDVVSALSLLHTEGLVFGDLRKPNVLITKKEQGVGGMLIDFDWCAGHKKGRYPVSLNETNNTWAEGVTRGGLMEKKHDEYMLTVLFEPER